MAREIYGAGSCVGSAVTKLASSIAVFDHDVIVKAANEHAQSSHT